MRFAGLLVVLLVVGAGLWGVLRGGQEQTAITLNEARLVPVEGENRAANLYLNIENTGGADRLISASTAQGRPELYSPEDPKGPAMPAESSAVLAADGAHVKISDFDTGLGEGQLVPVSLFFERAGEVRTRARVDAPISKGAAVNFGLFGDGDICVVGEGEPAPEVSLHVTEVESGWQVVVVSDGFSFDRDLMGGPHLPGTGHGHLYVGGLKLGRLFSPEVLIKELPAGSHIVRVTLNTNDHRAYVVDGEPVTASATINVGGN